jgi:hypothetical protein
VLHRQPVGFGEHHTCAEERPRFYRTPWCNNKEMATQAALRDAEWDVAALNWEHGPSPVQCVFRRVQGGGWEPWVFEPFRLRRPSAMASRSSLHSSGRLPATAPL